MIPENTVLLGSTYFGCIQYFSKFLLYPGRIIEQYDHYGKQTYRNRCRISGANGILNLSIPVHKGPNHKTFLKDIKIDYSKNWQKLHWKAIESAYMHSPFFEFYMDDIRVFFDKHQDYLIDLNLNILDFLLDALEISGGYTMTGEFIDSLDFKSGDRETRDRQTRDCRETIHPKRKLESDREFSVIPYPQVFDERNGFQENLSIIDLLFNEGPNARIILENSSRNLNYSN